MHLVLVGMWFILAVAQLTGDMEAPGHISAAFLMLCLALVNLQVYMLKKELEQETP